MVIQIDRSLDVPLYAQIEGSVRELILRGDLRPGEKLTSSRELARGFGVNRITVEKALRRLEADGLIYSRVGSGTFVKSHVSDLSRVVHQISDGPQPESLSRLWSPLFVEPRLHPKVLPTLVPRKGVKTISFAYAAPPPELFPAADFRRCIDYVLKRRVNEVARLGLADGLPSLKSSLAHWLGQRDIVAREEEIIITTGCQQSLDLIRKILIAPGDTVLLENPTYPGAVGGLAPTSAGLRELPIEPGGPDARTLGGMNSNNRPKLLYVVPNFQNPTGQTYSLKARRSLAERCGDLGIPIIEDDVFGELHYDGPVLPSLKALCPHLVIYIGSCSKLLNPGLRIGWIVAPRLVAEQLAVVKQTSDLHTNSMLQAALDEFCRRNLVHRHLKRVRRIFRNRRDAMAEALKRSFPSDATWKMPEGGLSMWVTLPPVWNTTELLNLAQAEGIQFLPGAAFYVRSALYNSLRLSFASHEEQVIQTGIRKLGELLHSRRSRRAWADQTPTLRRAIV